MHDHKTDDDGKRQERSAGDERARADEEELPEHDAKDDECDQPQVRDQQPATMDALALSGEGDLPAGVRLRGGAGGG
ncbi:MAG: hypothetical protein QM589_07100 [Thermomicrobiales bacterium]